MENQIEEEEKQDRTRVVHGVHEEKDPRLWPEGWPGASGWRRRRLRDGWGVGGTMREDNSLSTLRPSLNQCQLHNLVRTGVMARAHGGPVRTVHPMHTGSSVSFVRFDKEGRG